MVVGPVGLGGVLKYELLTGLLGNMPGLLGLGLRQIFYRFLFRELGRGVIIGRGVTIRHPSRIRIGHRVVIEDGVVLDAKGDTGEGIILRDGAFIGRGTILSMRGGSIEIAAAANIGSYCRIGTFANTRIGEKVLLAAYVYVVGGGHRCDRTDIPILDQPLECKGGADIGDGCWIGTHAVIMDGVKIGNDSIIGAHSTVTRDLPAYSVAYGSPARPQRDRRTALGELV